MSDRVEERRQAEVHDQKRLQNEKSQKEKDAAALKFKAAFAQKTGAEQKTAAVNKQSNQQKQSQQNMFMAKQGIAGRSLAERLVKGQDDSGKQDKELAGSRDNDLRTDSEHREGDSIESSKDDGLQQTERFDAPVNKDEQHKDQSAEQQSQGQNPGQGQQQSGGQQQQHKDKDHEDTVGALKAPKGGGGKTDEAATSTKVAIGKSLRTAAAERIPQPVMQALVDTVAIMAGQGMQEFQIQLKDDALGGGSVRVTLGKDKKLKVVFTLKDASAKRLLDASKGLLMRMFERKGMALQSLEVKLRGEA